jgi:RES domain-containing protein
LSVSLWRIAVDAPGYLADDLSGKGAETTGGRWNAVGRPAVYAATSRALACLETVVHLNSGGLPLNRYLVEIVIPAPVWNAAQSHGPTSLPVGWDADPASRTSVDFGTQWLQAKTSALLIVPSVIVPEEANILINPLHPDSGAVTATKIRKWLYDPRLTK